MTNISITTKRCSRCRAVKARQEFRVDPKHSDALASACKVCERTADAARHLILKQNPNSPDTRDKRCSTCQIVKTADSFYRNSTASDGRQWACKPCQKIYTASHSPDPSRRVTLTERMCTGCQMVKPASCFGSHQKTRSGLTSKCSTCQAHKHRKQAFGISEAQYKEMIEAQNGRCAICLRDPLIVHRFGFVVDHCHVSGNVRALLCFHCNAGIGWLGDDPERIESARQYILNHRTLLSVLHPRLFR